MNYIRKKMKELGDTREEFGAAAEAVNRGGGRGKRSAEEAREGGGWGRRRRDPVRGGVQRAAAQAGGGERWRRRERKVVTDGGGGRGRRPRPEAEVACGWQRWTAKEVEEGRQGRRRAVEEGEGGDA